MDAFPDAGGVRLEYTLVPMTIVQKIVITGNDALTTAKIRDILLVDPNLDEERMADARLTVTTDENGDIRAMQKGLSGSFSYDEVKRIIETAQKVGEAIRPILRS